MEQPDLTPRDLLKFVRLEVSTYPGRDWYRLYIRHYPIKITEDDSDDTNVWKDSHSRDNKIREVLRVWLKANCRIELLSWWLPVDPPWKTYSELGHKTRPAKRAPIVVCFDEEIHRDLLKNLLTKGAPLGAPLSIQADRVLS